MKVHTHPAAVPLNSYLKQARNQPQPSEVRASQKAYGAAAGSDKVELSDRAKEVQQAAQTLKTMSDTRPEKVAQVKKELDNGTYQVAGARIAARMMSESFENERILQQIDIHG